MTQKRLSLRDATWTHRKRVKVKIWTIISSSMFLWDYASCACFTWMQETFKTHHYKWMNSLIFSIVIIVKFQNWIVMKVMEWAQDHPLRSWPMNNVWKSRDSWMNVIIVLDTVDDFLEPLIVFSTLSHHFTFIANEEEEAESSEDNRDQRFLYESAAQGMQSPNIPISINTSSIGGSLKDILLQESVKLAICKRYSLPSPHERV